jgi:hypothetical protein
MATALRTAFVIPIPILFLPSEDLVCNPRRLPGNGR